MYNVLDTIEALLISDCEVYGLTSQESNLGLGVFSPYSSTYIVQPPPSLDDNGKAKLQK